MQETDRKMQETDRRMKKTDRQMKKTDRQMKEMRKEADERWQKLEEQLKENNRQLGGLHNSFGALIETLMAARIWEKFRSPPYNYDLHRAHMNVRSFRPESSRAAFEIDILLSNGKTNGDGIVIAVEVKSRLKKEDIADQIERMKLISQFPPAEAVGKKILGALASGVSLPEPERAMVHAAGFFLLELTGETVELVRPPEGFQPVEWCYSPEGE
jgi:hypothetical protein